MHTPHSTRPCTSHLADKLEQAEAMTGALLEITAQPAHDLATVRGVLYALRDTLADAAGTAEAIDTGWELAPVA